MSKSILTHLYKKHLWTETVDFFETRSYRQKQKLAAYKKTIKTEEYLNITDEVLKGN